MRGSLYNYLKNSTIAGFTKSNNATLNAPNLSIDFDADFDNWSTKFSTDFDILPHGDLIENQ